MNTGTKKIGVDALVAEAERKFKQGKLGEAKSLCDRVLATSPDNVGALNILGGCLARSGKLAQAIQVAERVCSLSPGNAVFNSNLSYLHSVAGNVPQAVLAMARAVLCDTNNAVYQTKFAQLTNYLEFYELTAETAVIQEAIKVCLGNPDIDVASFSTAWHSLLLLDPFFIKILSLVQNGDFEEQAEQVICKELEKPLSAPFFLLGLKSLHAVDARLERIMTFFRRLFVSRFDECDAERFLPFLCAVAEHCNLNEFVYGCTEEEWSMVKALEGAIDLSQGFDETIQARIALLACYEDLLRLDKAGAIAEASAVSQSPAFRALIENTVSVPAEMREYCNDIPVISSSPGSVQSAVSSAVARQYEENPYPRWRHLDIPVLPEKLRVKGRGRNLLVAGCGTGHEPLSLATRYPEAQVLAVDLSVPSLAYGRQKAVELGIDNVDFMQADILELDALGREFDLIACSGVLHHMEEPVEGWRKLLACLKPDGLMKIALYSETARQSVVLCREWIAEQGFTATPEGIRGFRQAIMGLDAESPLKEIMNWTDFYTMSMCRDLVFHVQEHRVTLPWVKSVLGDLDLSLLLMRISNPLFKREYLSMFPDDSGVKNLDHLHAYETHNPRAFRDMYQFWCCRKGSVSAQIPPEWFYTTGSR